jgi:hypothetical protein
VFAFVAAIVAACGGSAATGSIKPDVTPAGGTSVAATPAGPTANSTGASKALDACSLITVDEAAAALGQSVDPGTVPEPGAHSCLFSPQVLGTDGVEISLTGLDTFKPDQKSIPGLTITKVSGIGDAAYYVNMGAPYITLNVLKGQTSFSVGVILKGASDSDLMDLEKTLALAALGRI